MIWVRNISGGYDLTHRLSGLRWANERPRGDRDASFVFHEKWNTAVPEIDKGDVIHIGDGIDVLWAGRIEEHDRGGDRDEQIAVTAYGLGVRLKDSTMQEIYVDRDLAAFGQPSVARRLVLHGAGYRLGDGSSTPIGVGESGSGAPGIEQSIARLTGDASLAETVYWANGIALDRVTYDGDVLGTMGTTVDWNTRIVLASDDVWTAADLADTNAADVSNQTLSRTADSTRHYVILQIYYAAALAATDGNYVYQWRNPAIWGTHGLTARGSMPTQGLYTSQMVQDAADRATGITIRRIDATTFVVEQAGFKTPTLHEEVISKLNEVHQHERNWGTWGPDSPLDAGMDGYFDYTATEPTVAHWFAQRADCDDLDLHTEMATLFNRVQVHFQDTAGSSQIVTRTASVPELDDDGIAKTATLNAGTLTTTLAQQLGDAILALSGSFAPARGSATLSRPIQHKDRGTLLPHYMRADGANLRVPDILPSTTLFELSSNPDRRTLFPIKRVEVDCSGFYPLTTVELDQTNDALVALQARLEQDKQLVGV